MDKLLFGTAGVPISSKERDSIAGVERIKELGLGCMELEFVRGVKMGKDAAEQVRKTASQLGIMLSVHAPYYINLNSPEKSKIDASIERIMASARVGDLCGARSIVFHAAYYQGEPKEKVYQKVKSLLNSMVEVLRKEGVDVNLRPETTGKESQFGTLEELLRLSQEVEGVLPCIDFSHMHARTGRNNTQEEFERIFEKIKDALGKKGLEEMHMHISGIEYGKKGEIRHLILKESDLKYKELVNTLKKFGAMGLVICESPNLEDDALTLQSVYKDIF